MWRSFESALVEYAIVICDEWISRNYKDTCREKIINLSKNIKLKKEYPSFVGNKEFHDSHKSNLLRKKPEYYSKFNWTVPNNLEYVWSVK